MEAITDVEGEGLSSFAQSCEGFPKAPLALFDVEY
jgi:hypothetical protein